MSPSDIPPEQLAAIADVVGDRGSNLIVRLFVNNVQPVQDTPVSALTEATFPGYEPLSGPLWNGPFEDDVGEVYYESDPLRFQWIGAPGTAQTVYGVLVSVAQGGLAGLAGGATEYQVRADRIGAPLSFDAPGQQIELIVRVPAVAG